MHFILVLGFALSACLATPVTIKDGRGKIAIELWASAKCVEPGDMLIVRATVTNQDSRTHLVEVKDQSILDLSIGYRTETGSTIIKWSDAKPLTPDLTRLELKPGESRTIELRWVVIEPAPSAIGVSARFIDDLRFSDHPLSPFMMIYGPGGCPGPFGP